MFRYTLTRKSVDRRKRREDAQAERNIPIPISIILLENVRHALERNTRLHKQIERQHAAPLDVVRVEQQADVVVTKTVSERDERGRELVERDGAAAVDVEAVEQLAPFRQEAPQAALRSLSVLLGL